MHRSALLNFLPRPADGQVSQGGSFTLTVVAEGAGTLTYQWEAQILQNDWAVIEGATEATYTRSRMRPEPTTKAIIA